MCGAPRIYEKVYNRIVTTAKSAGGAKWKIFQWAFGVGRQVSEQRVLDGPRELVGLGQRLLAAGRQPDHGAPPVLF